MHTVVETGVCLRHAKQAGVGDDERQAIIDMLASDPSAGDLMKGTGGARKIRFAKDTNAGKSGEYRIITYFAADDIPVFLLDIYGKGEKSNLTQKQANDLAKILEQIAPAYRAGTRAAAGGKKG